VPADHTKILQLLMQSFYAATLNNAKPKTVTIKALKKFDAD
jgi:hypothetical protein